MEFFISLMVGECLSANASLSTQVYFLLAFLLSLVTISALLLATATGVSIPLIGGLLIGASFKGVLATSFLLTCLGFPFFVIAREIYEVYAASEEQNHLTVVNEAAPNTTINILKTTGVAANHRSLNDTPFDPTANVYSDNGKIEEIMTLGCMVWNSIDSAQVKHNLLVHLGVYDIKTFITHCCITNNNFRDKILTPEQIAKFDSLTSSLKLDEKILKTKLDNEYNATYGSLDDNVNLQNKEITCPQLL